MGTKGQVLRAMKKDETPFVAGKTVEFTIINQTVEENAKAQLKKVKAIVTPNRCYWQVK